MINHRVDATLLEDRILLHGASGVQEYPLAYQIHARLIQTGELARLIAEHLRDEVGDELPPPGSRIRLALPQHWGLVCLSLPYLGVGDLAQPMHQLAWEVDCNAPEQVEQYLFDYQERGANSGGGTKEVSGETLVLAVRQSLVVFCRTLCEELGWRLMEIIPAGEAQGEFLLDLARAQEHRDALARERYKPVVSWRRLILGGGLVLLILGGLWLVSRRQPASPPPRLPMATADSMKESVTTAVELAGMDSLTGVPSTSRGTIMVRPPTLQAWGDLLSQMAKHEANLPEHMVLDATGALVRQEGPTKTRLNELVSRPSRVSRVGRDSYWVHFDQPLESGRLIREDPTKPVERFAVVSLEDLPGRLSGPPSRLMLQRRRSGGNAASPLGWRFGLDSGALGAPSGWQVTVFPAVRSAPSTGASR